MLLGCDYPVLHHLHSDHNKKVMGKFKDETNGLPIAEFVGLKAKMYSVLNADNHSHCTAKGIKKSVVKQSFHHKLYVNALSLTKCEQVTQKQIVSKNHQLFTVEINKAGLHPFDDKRYILPDGITTLAHGHYKLRILLNE